MSASCRFGRWLIMPVLAAVLLLFGGIAAAEPPDDGSADAATQVWEEIQALKQRGEDIPQALYDRYFALNGAEGPAVGPRPEGGGTGGLDQGIDGCPGLLITQTGSTLNFSDAGQTNDAQNDCTNPPCRTGRDLIYAVDLIRSSWLQISTCGSTFDTYLCIFRNSCLTPGQLPVLVNDDAPGICGGYSLKAAVSACFLEAGRYYIVLDGYNAVAAGHYMFSVREIPDSICGSVPEIACPANFRQHVEGTDEAPCEFGMTVACEDGICGEIEPRGDLDEFTFSLDACSQVEFSVYADDTPGRSGFGHGLNPTVRLLGAPGCDFPLYVNDNSGGSLPLPVGNDSWLRTLCLRPGTYWFEIAGNATTGPYEFTIHCTPCLPVPPVVGMTVTHPSANRNCLAWPAQPGAPTYYIWRQASGDNWIQVGSTYRTTFCETLSGGNGAVYQVFTDPCGRPTAG